MENTRDYLTKEMQRFLLSLAAIGTEVARVVYRPEKPLSCGAKVWIETANEVEVV